MNFMWIPIISDLKNGIVGLLLMLDGFVYGIISSSYKIFMAIAGARLLSTEAFSMIANKIYIIIGVCMLFVLAYAILRGIIDPDQMTKGDFGGPKILKSVMIAVIGLGITPVIFNMLYQAQGIILEQDVLVKLFFRTDDDSVDMGTVSLGEGENTQSVSIGEVPYNKAIKDIGGAVTATSVWQAFFYPSTGNLEDAKEIEAAADDYFVSAGLWGVGCAAAATAAGVGLAGFTFGISLLIGAAAGLTCVAADHAVDNALADAIGDKISLDTAYTLSAQGEGFGHYALFVEAWSDGDINYIFTISTIVGLFVCYAFVSFSIDMGVRAAKLAYYQIIAPIPLILQILPKFQDTFKKYVRSIISTFLEVFIRISVVYIVVYIICHLTELFSTGSTWGSLNTIEALLARALLIVGLVIFAKQAPKLIADSLGLQTGDMRLGIGKKLAEGGVFAAGGVAGGAITGAVRNFKNGWGDATRNNKGQPLSKRVANRANVIGSGIAGGFSGGFNAAKRARHMMKGGNPVTPQQAKEIAHEGAEKAGLNKEKRANYKKDNEHYREGKRIHGAAAAHIRDARDMVSKWATGPAYTDHDDRLASTFAKTRDLKKDMKSTVADDDNVVKKSNAKSRVMRMDVEDVAYNQELEKQKMQDARYKQEKHRVMNNYLSRNAGESDSDYEKRFKEWMYKSSEESDRYTAEWGSNQINIDADRKFRSKNERRNFTVAYGSQAYDEAQNELDKMLKKADDELTAAENKAIGENLVKAASGIENKTSRALRKFMDENGSNIREFANVEFMKDGDKTVTLGQYIEDNFGAKATIGEPDYIKVAQNALKAQTNPDNKAMKIELRANKTDEHPKVQIIIDATRPENEQVQLVNIDNSGNVVVDANGRPTSVVDPDNPNIVIDPSDHESIARYVKRMGFKNAKTKHINSTDNSTWSPSSDIIKQLNEAAARQHDRFTSTEEWFEKHARKKIEQDKKDKK